MDKANNIKDFQNIFINEINKFLGCENYKLTKKNKFTCSCDENAFSIIFNLYKRPTFIEIQTQNYYGNSGIDILLKNNHSNYKYENICGGDTRFICEYYFKQEYQHNYSNLIYDLNTSINYIVELWIDDYVKYIKPFFKDCSSPEKLNVIVNGDRIETTGLNLTYQNRVLKSLFVALRAGFSFNQLTILSQQYEEYLCRKQLSYLSDFLEVKQNIMNNVPNRG